MSNYIIRLEEKKDYREVENLVRESFWNVYRPGCSYLTEDIGKGRLMEDK